MGDMNWLEKIQHNWASIKWWTFLIATGLLLLDKIDQYVWAGLAATLMGITRAFEYFAFRKNGKTTNGNGS